MPALAPMSQQCGPDNRPPVDLELMRQALAPVVREAWAPLYASHREVVVGQASVAACVAGADVARRQVCL
jgi:hypothetical protein